jgi:purine-binding chemotaxis protein CheW
VTTEHELPALIVRVSGVTCALPCVHVVETMRPLPVVALDTMPGYASGVATIRGMATPVIDLASLLGRTGGAAPTRFVTVRAADRIVAIAVDEVVGLTRYAAGEFIDRPPLLSDGDHPLIQSLAVKDRSLHLVLDAARLVDTADHAW